MAQRKKVTLKSNTKVVKGTWHAVPALLQDVGVDHGCGQIIMSQQGLNRADVGTALKQVGGKGMAKGMSADTLGQTRAAHSYLDRLVNHAGVNMMAADHAAKGVS